MMNPVFEKAKTAGRAILHLSCGQRNEALLSVASSLERNARALLAANAEDLSLMDKNNPLYDRLKLTEERISTIASDMRNVASLPDPLGNVLEDGTLPNGLRLRKISVPFGVIGVICEARPNVTFDVFSLCFKSGSACILKGGHDAGRSNEAALSIIREGLSERGVDNNVFTLLPSTHEAAHELMEAVGYVDLVIPRGGRRLIDFVRNNTKVPCIETGAGVVHAYFDSTADLVKGAAIINNAKTRRVSVCNALDCLIVHSSRLEELPTLCRPLSDSGVEIRTDERSFESLSGKYPSNLLTHSVPEDYGTEFMSYRMAVKTVDSVEEAVEHISRYGSGHSECIITEDERSAEYFRLTVDAACVYVNAPTSFTDGAQFGLGAEIGISTQKLGARGPMGLKEITTYKWLIDGSGQVRK